MKRTNISNKQDLYQKSTFKETSSNKNSYYTSSNREEQKSSFNFIEETKLRIVQQNLVSVTGLSTDFDNPDVLCDNQHFGKYGNVNKIIISTQGKYKNAFIQVYITFDSPAEAAFMIKAMDGLKIGGKQISATFGTTKYCTYFLKQNECRNDKCFYLHSFDTKNELVDGVKNNLDFLDQKAEKLINKNLRMYLQKQLIQHNLKQQSQFPSYTETIQYLIDQGILKKQIVQKLRLEIKNIKNQSNQSKCKEKNQYLNHIQTPKNKQNINIEQINNKQTNNNQNVLSNCNNNQSSIKNSSPSKNSIILNYIEDGSNQSNRTNQALTQKKYEDCLLQQQCEQNENKFDQLDNKFYESKNKKCNSLSTAPSPTKYQKNSQIQQQNIDKTIEKRIINQIMKNKLIYKSKMDFVTHLPNYAKEQNYKIINYVRKHLLNEV